MDFSGSRATAFFEFRHTLLGQVEIVERFSYREVCLGPIRLKFKNLAVGVDGVLPLLLIIDITRFQAPEIEGRFFRLLVGERYIYLLFRLRILAGPGKYEGIVKPGSRQVWVESQRCRSLADARSKS